MKQSWKRLSNGRELLLLMGEPRIGFSVFMKLANAWHRHLSQHTPKIPHPPIQNLIYRPYLIKKVDVITSEVVINVFVIY